VSWKKIALLPFLFFEFAHPFGIDDIGDYLSKSTFLDDTGGSSFLDGALSCLDLGGLAGSLDLSSILGKIDLGICSIDGGTQCEEKKRSHSTESEKVLPSYSPSMSCEGKVSGPEKGVEEAVIKQGIDPYDRRAKLYNPKTGSLHYSGGKTIQETKKSIVEDSGAMTETISRSSRYLLVSLNGYSPSPLKSKCEGEGGVAKAIACEVENGGASLLKREKEIDKAYDDQTKKRMVAVELATTPKRTVVYASEEVRRRLPVNKNFAALDLGIREMNIKTIFRTDYINMRDHRKALAKILSERDAFLAAHRFEDKSDQAAYTIQAGVLP
jgi:hypothetical protein